MIVKALRALAPGERARLLDRAPRPGSQAHRAAQRILGRVRARGDAALRELTRELDGVEVEGLEVPGARLERAWRALRAEDRRALEQAARNIARYHRAQRPRALRVRVAPGLLAGREPRALGRVGLYAPGGRAAYPSTVLMTALPARAAGVRELVLCSPPGQDGWPARSVLAAARLARVDRVFRVGGAQAIAAMALGTESVPRCDKVVGPGNAYVQAAKLVVQGLAGIDAPAGPSEALILADASADPELVARELLCQAEHGPDSASVALTTSGAHARAVAKQAEALLSRQPRRGVIEASLGARGAVLWARGPAEALAFAEAMAPEHLVLMVARPERWLPRVRSAGAVFLGPASAAALGDYAAGPSHVLPTGGAARWSSGLQAEDFVRWVNWVRATPQAARRLGPLVGTLARLEGLEAHARSAEARLREPHPARPAGLRSRALQASRPPRPLRPLRLRPRLADPEASPRRRRRRA